MQIPLPGVIAGVCIGELGKERARIFCQRMKGDSINANKDNLQITGQRVSESARKLGLTKCGDVWQIGVELTYNNAGMESWKVAFTRTG